MRQSLSGSESSNEVISHDEPGLQDIVIDTGKSYLLAQQPELLQLHKDEWLLSKAWNPYKVLIEWNWDKMADILQKPFYKWRFTRSYTHFLERNDFLFI